MGELSEIGDLVFSMVIGYLGALEFLYVVRHLYHWSCHQSAEQENDESSLKTLQERMRKQLSEAETREALAGANAMQDGVLYKEGFRIDPQQQDIDSLKEMQKLQDAKEKRRREIEIELAKQKKIEEETRRELEKAEEELARQRKQAKEEEEENARKLLEAEQQQEAAENEKRKYAEEQRLLEEQRETEEKTRQLFEAEKQHEEEQRWLEEQREAEENSRRLLEAEKHHEGEQRMLEEQREAEENIRRLLEAEKQHEEEQHIIERENERIENAERQREARQSESKIEKGELLENERNLIEAEMDYEEQQRQIEEQEEAQDAFDISKRLLEIEREQSEIEDDELEISEQSRILSEAERERKQKLIEENARKFLEAEQEMVELQQQMSEAEYQRLVTVNVESAPQTPVVEEPCIKKIITRRSATPEADNERLTHTVKTQFGQTSSEPYSLTSKPLLFPSISDDATSLEPNSSQQSSFSTQPSEEYTTGTENSVRTMEMQFPQIERQDPDGEDNAPPIQYTDEYLRSLDGIKHRPLVREDGSGRRRAFKKRRSSGSSNSSRDSRTSRDEELKMFTSLEEEELQSMQKGEGDFTPIKYSSEPTLKVKVPHRRHKRSPAKDAKSGDESLRGSLEMLGGENTNPWGEVMPEHYKQTEFWKREKAMSIDEEEIDIEIPATGDNVEDTTATNIPKTSSFEDATETQNEEAITILTKQNSKEDVVQEKETEAAKEDVARSDVNTNLIFSGEYTKAMDKDWHSGHFCCWQCDESLTGQRYVIRDDHPYCIKCYENVFANNCEECNKIIGIDSKDLSYKDKHWHEACFLCFKCHLSLVDKQFGAKADKIYCGTCYDAQFASRCDGCGEVFRAGTKKMEYKTRQWHENCFCCCVCKMAIGTKSFIPREQEIYCAGCYEEKFATRCIKCNKVITSGGVTYKNEPWHRECFTCTHCNITLAGQRFTSRDEKPYCAECFGELFAKRCTACVKPITGIGGTRFISFEDRHWHHDCFVCASCKTSLVGRGFITDGPDIICPECAKQKLM